MSNQAHVILRGTVMQEPQVSQTSTNKTWMKINLAVQTTKKQENSQYPASDYYSVNVFDRYAENLIGKIKAKTKLLVIGDMYMSDPWNDRNGNTHISPTVNANIIEITSGGNYSNYNKNNNNNQQAAAVQATDEEAPF